MSKDGTEAFSDTYAEQLAERGARQAAGACREPGRRHGRAGRSAATTVVGVIGDPVAHSLSPLLHNTAFAALGLDWVSVGFPVPAGAAAEALAGLRRRSASPGLSVTMPHKAAVAGAGRRAAPRSPGGSARSTACVNRDGG